MADNCAKSCGVCTTAATLLSVPVTTAATVRPYPPMYTSAPLRAAWSVSIELPKRDGQSHCASHVAKVLACSVRWH